MHDTVERAPVLAELGFAIRWASDPLKTLRNDQKDGRITPFFLDEVPDGFPAIERMVLICVKQVDEDVREGSNRVLFQGTRTCHLGIFPVEGWCDRTTKTGRLIFKAAAK